MNYYKECENFLEETVSNGVAFLDDIMTDLESRGFEFKPETTTNIEWVGHNEDGDLVVVYENMGKDVLVEDLKAKDVMDIIQVLLDILYFRSKHNSYTH